MAGGYVLDKHTQSSRPDLYFPIACLLSYAVTVCAILFALYLRMQVSFKVVMRSNLGRPFTSIPPSMH